MSASRFMPFPVSGAYAIQLLKPCVRQRPGRLWRRGVIAFPTQNKENSPCRCSARPPYSLSASPSPGRRPTVAKFRRSLAAKSWLLLDISSNQVLNTEKPDDRIEPASLTK